MNQFLPVPAQVVKTGRQLIVRLFAYEAWEPIFFRLVDQFVTAARSRPVWV